MTRPAPYPADTRAKGWRFELDYEQIEQSDTWGVTKPEARAWLLMLWLTAWKQTPCGSLPADQEVIAGKLGIPDDLWARHKGTLLRGWWQADDGRLYHDTLAKRVSEMMGKRRSDADRQAKRRAVHPPESGATPADSAASHADVTRDTDPTTVGVHPESSTDNRPLKKDISKPSASHPLPGGSAAGFNDFWLAWPKGERKQDKAKCLEHWKRNTLGAVADLILADVRVKRGTQKWAEGFIEAPLVYLRGRRWEDGVEPEAPAPAAHALTVPSAAAQQTVSALAELDAHAAKAASPEAQAARVAAINKLRGIGAAQKAAA